MNTARDMGQEHLVVLGQCKIIRAFAVANDWGGSRWKVVMPPIDVRRKPERKVPVADDISKVFRYLVEKLYCFTGVLGQYGDSVVIFPAHLSYP